jgi:hypothetical protein
VGWAEGRQKEMGEIVEKGGTVGGHDYIERERKETEERTQRTNTHIRF